MIKFKSHKVLIRKSRHSSDGTESSRFDERSAEGYAEYVFERVPKPHLRCVGYDGYARYSFALYKSVSPICASCGRSKVVSRDNVSFGNAEGFFVLKIILKEVL